MHSIPVPQTASEVHSLRHVPLTVHDCVAEHEPPHEPPQPSLPHTRPAQFGVHPPPPPVHVPAALQV